MSLRRIVLLSLCLVAAGCHPDLPGQADEQKDPYFLAGKNRLQTRDYQGAIEMFEKALDVNPRSASAHFELGVLYEQQQSDYSAALYHYERAVMVKTNGLSADLARQRIQECKRELAKTVTQPLSLENLQREVDALRAENVELKQRVKVWQDYYAARGVAYSNLVQPAPEAPLHPNPPAGNARREIVTAPSRVETPARTNPPPPTARQHTVVAGDTLASIARKYGVKLSVLQSANPGVEARRLRPGKTLFIPAP